MIEATQFFQDAAAERTSTTTESEEKSRHYFNGTFSKWHQVSPTSWRLVQENDGFGNLNTNTGHDELFRAASSGNNTAAAGNVGCVHQQTVLHSMDVFLAQTTHQPGQQQQGHGHGQQNGFVAGLDLVSPGERWVLDMEAFLKQPQPKLQVQVQPPPPPRRPPPQLPSQSSANANTTTSNGGGTNNSSRIYQDRHDIAVSSPLCLSTKTLTKSLLKPSAPISHQTIISKAAHFCLDALIPAAAGSERAPMKFSCYKGSGKRNNNDDDDYIPEGYEEFEAPPPNHHHKENDSTSEDHQQASSPVYYIMEVQNACKNGTTTPAGGTSTTTMLEEIAMIWNDTSLIAATSTHNNNNIPGGSFGPQGIKLKVISSATWKEVVGGGGRGGGEGEDTAWILSWLEEVPTLRLPQPVGSGWGAVPSLMLIVAFDPDSVQQSDNTLSSRRKRLLKQIERSIADGHIVLKFKRDDCLRFYPVESQISLLHFSIARKVQIVRHSISEEESLQKLLESSLMNAERFVPEAKKQQWDLIPNTLLMVLPNPLLPQNLAKWLRDPVIRRSDYDPCLANVLLHLDCWQIYTPPACHYVDREILGSIWHLISSVQTRIAQNFASVKAGTAAMGQPQPYAGGFASVDAKALYKLCVDMETPQGPYAGLNVQNRLRKASVTLRFYIERMLAALQTERLRCYEDMKKHDLYSVHWKEHQINIPPPSKPRTGCPDCRTGTGRGKADLRCAYHSAAVYFASDAGRMPIPGKPIPIRTKSLLEKLPRLFFKMHPDDNIIVKIHVSGVREDYPLISTGDLVRLQFHCPGEVHLTTEVIAEVADVVTKTEEVTLRLPPPFRNINGHVRGCTQGAFPYLQALLHTKDFILDARPMLTYELTPIAFAGKAREISEHNNLRFDVRFGFQGGRGFDIIRAALVRAITTVDAAIGASKRETPKLENFCRVLAPSDQYISGLDGKVTILRNNFDFEFPINEKQKEAVVNIVNKFHGSAPFIIEGPAGTGKTMCVCEAVLQVYRTSPMSAKILVCAPSDAACDVLACRLLPLLPKKKLLRVNWWSRKVASVQPALLSSSPMDSTGDVFVLPSPREMQQASVIVCQCFVAESLTMVGKPKFTYLFLDEASQAMEAEVMVPITQVSIDCSIVLAGDPKQLGPTIRDPVAAKMGLGLSLQERLLKLPLYTSDKYRVRVRLVNNYRSNDALLTVPSSLFYGGSLEALAPDEVANPFENFGDLGPAGFPLLLCDVAHGKEHSKMDTPSFYNMEECNAISSLAKGLLQCKSKEGLPPLHTGQISVISPFRAQVLALRTVLRAANLGGINVGVVEDFQGQEAKVVFISTVLTQDHERWNRPAETTITTDEASRTTQQQRLGFLFDPKKFNVAVTRAQALCIIVGHAEYLEQSGTYWSALLGHIRRNDGVLGEEADGEEDGNSHFAEDDDDLYGVADLLRRVAELHLLGSGAEEDKHDLSFYYSDVPQWKVMLA